MSFWINEIREWYDWEGRPVQGAQIAPGYEALKLIPELGRIGRRTQMPPEAESDQFGAEYIVCGLLVARKGNLDGIRILLYSDGVESYALRYPVSNAVGFFDGEQVSFAQGVDDALYFAQAGLFNKIVFA